MIDPITLIFYGIVCTILATFLPQRLKLWMRAGIGAFVGIGAAFALPLIRAFTGL